MKSAAETMQAKRDAEAKDAAAKELTEEEADAIATVVDDEAYAATACNPKGQDSDSRRAS